MYVGNGEDLLKSLMKVQSKCPNCGTTLIFENSARLAKDNGVSENAIMCHECRKVFNVNITPNNMSILGELTKYNFSKDTKKQATKPLSTRKSSEKPKTNPLSTKTTSKKQTKPEVTQKSNVKETYQLDSSGKGIVNILFYKTDVEFGLLRLSKTKIFSELWFILLLSIFLISSYAILGFADIISSLIMAFILTIPVFVIGWVISKLIAKPKVPNEVSNPVTVSSDTMNAPQQELNQNVGRGIDVKKETVSESSDEKYLEKDNMGTRHDDVNKANAYWLGERMAKEEKDPFTLYSFSSAKDAEDALLELPYIHKADDTGSLICDDVYIFGFYEVSTNNYEAIVCGKDLTYDDFKLAEDSFISHGGTRKNNLEPDKSVKKTRSTKATGEVKFREKFNHNQGIYECYDAKTKADALEFLKQKEVSERLYYVCVYTPEGDYGRDIDGIYQM